MKRRSLVQALAALPGLLAAFRSASGAEERGSLIVLGGPLHASVMVHDGFEGWYQQLPCGDHCSRMVEWRNLGDGMIKARSPEDVPCLRAWVGKTPTILGIDPAYPGAEESAHWTGQWSPM